MQSLAATKHSTLLYMEHVLRAKSTVVAIAGLGNAPRLAQNLSTGTKADILTL